MDKYSEEYITANADTFNWDKFYCDMNKYSHDFADMFKDEIQNRVWLNKDGEYHRLDGPAYINSDGDKEWYINDKLHRVDGPSVEWVDGEKHWYLNGKLHRLDGPAVESNDGTKQWCLNGKYYTEEEYKIKVKELTNG